eukprot:CAMPEP_0174286784 /NCGR_PEP_ID=MMETSP0809-20121228/12998_1 /TAXON_ID=73025 ORGANISM="Eutreptiella gymnastica-like, Strain CCMP1594" /NCGR_SAMPLE_ID=MMETSP0809 /ASSEMBLY_ACC=CAM_ASM_000658 /LENGTH=441 /DNA_ID=CAMNT_0015382983 /DNA_START=114 /DNA_END=1439 /DNA_ORIENTATION=+
MSMLHDKPDDPVQWFQEYAATCKRSGNKASPPGVVSVRLNKGMSWSQIAGKLPCGRTEAEKIQRAQLFNKIDCNHNEYVSPEEAINGMRANLPFQHDAIEDVMRTACRHIQKLTKQGQEVRPPNIAENALTRPQFRLLLVYLRRYCDLLAMFDEFDTDEDRNVDLNEFKGVCARLDSWGIRVHYPEKAFEALDKRKRGEVPFQDFADWVIGKQLEQEPCTAEDELDAADEADAQMGGGAGRSMKSGRPMKSSKVSSFRRGRTGAIDWGLIAERLPYGRSQVEKDRRKELFNLIDVNGNGYISLAETDKGLRDILKLEEVFDCKPAIMRAFQAAKDVHKESKARLGADFVTKCEFRILLEYLRKYFELFVMFDRMDDDNDRRLSEEEFVRHAKKLTEWGVKSTDFKAEFAKMDTNHGGKVLFDEFCHWAIPQNLDVEDDDDR